MKKIPCLFQREFHGKGLFTLLETPTPGCEWVLAGDGLATRKRDGTACLVKGGRLYKRYDAKRHPTRLAEEQVKAASRRENALFALWLVILAPIAAAQWVRDKVRAVLS